MNKREINNLAKAAAAPPRRTPPQCARLRGVDPLHPRDAARHAAKAAYADGANEDEARQAARNAIRNALSMRRAERHADES